MSMGDVEWWRQNVKRQRRQLGAEEFWVGSWWVVVCWMLAGSGNPPAGTQETGERLGGGDAVKELRAGAAEVRSPRQWCATVPRARQRPKRPCKGLSRPSSGAVPSVGSSTGSSTALCLSPVPGA